MANVDIVYSWLGGYDLCDPLVFGIDHRGVGYCLGLATGRWEESALVTSPHITPALAALARIAETLGSVTWRSDNRLGDPANWPPVRWISLAEAREIWPDQQKPQGSRLEAGREEAEESGVGESLAGSPGVEPPAPLAESLEE